MNKGLNNRTEEILNSLDGVQRASTSDFFYTRLRARLEKETLSPAAPRHWTMKPLYALAVLALVIGMNALVLFNQAGSSNTTETAMNADKENMQTLAAEYSVTDAGSLYDLNQEK
jgi:hypothetical protein